MNFKYFNCPICGKALIDLENQICALGFHHYWCDECNIDITIDENKTTRLFDTDEEKQEFTDEEYDLFENCEKNPSACERCEHWKRCLYYFTGEVADE